MGVVAISREVGSLGDEMAGVVADKLQYKLMDRQHVHRMVQACDNEFSLACSAFEEEHKPTGFFERISFGNPSFAARFISLAYEAAAEGDVVLIGRGVQVPLAKVPGILKCRIVAPLELRVSRIKERMGLSQGEALDYVQKHDKERTALLESIYRHEVTDSEYFDLVLNTAQFDMANGAEVIVLAAQKLAAMYDFSQMQTQLKTMSFAKLVEAEIKKHISTTFPRDITVEADASGGVTIEGIVTMPRVKETAGQIAEKVEGVTKVVNNLKTIELSF